MDYKTALLTFGVGLLLLGMIGKVKLKELEVGTSNNIARSILGALGVILILLSFFYPVVAGQGIEETVPKNKTTNSENGTQRLLAKSIYVGEFTSDNNHSGVSIRTELKLVENRIVGVYLYGMREGTISGNLKDNTIFFEWHEAGGHGHGTLYLKENGKRFSGTWGYKESSNNGGSWNGHIE